jgi:hypothetical protein
MYLFNTEPLTSLGKCPLNAVLHVLCGPVPQHAGTPSLSLLHILNLSIISIAVLENTGLQERATFSSLIVRPAGTGDQSKATCVAGRGASRSAKTLI